MHSRTVLCFNFLGDGLRDALDQRMRLQRSPRGRVRSTRQGTPRPPDE